MARIVLGLISGLVFGFGLALSGMDNPAKVQNFLDLAGTWDPSLAFVMGGAIAVAMPAFFLFKKLEKPILDKSFHLPTKSALDKRLLLGAGIFGIGWGLGGLCPGPALSSAGLATTSALVFVAAMIIGMAVARRA
ncbi:YeeE/YedE family protein [Pseudovibrio exalbescens]|uniref:YeeE/YedE family protein n=1 Tax=Pseudovibrio exalbescens TaxID=197461 RepID=UPI000C9B3E91|nr:YeeE/YedE family protein [Pseudovibrio exalbescens]